jgi:hypothetical protein
MDSCESIGFNYTGWSSAITSNSFPNALAAFQADFGQGSTSAG